MIDIESPTWKRIERWLDDEEARLLDDLRSPARDHQNTTLLRGRLLQLDALRRLPSTQAILPNKPII